MNNFPKIEDFQWESKDINNKHNPKKNTSILHALFDGYLQPNIGNNPFHSLEFFKTVIDKYTNSSKLLDLINNSLGNVSSLFLILHNQFHDKNLKGILPTAKHVFNISAVHPNKPNLESNVMLHKHESKSFFEVSKLILDKYVEYYKDLFEQLINQ